MAKEELALIEVQELKPEVVFTPKGMDDLLKKIETTAKSFIIDSSTDEGRAEIKSLAYRVARSKTIIDELGKKYYEKAKKIVDDTNAQRKTAREFLDTLKDEIRKPVTEWEAEQERIRQEKIKAEEERVARIRMMITVINNTGDIEYDTPLNQLRQRISTLEGIIIGDSYQEFQAEANQVKTSILEKLNNALTKRVAYEKEQADLKAEKDRQEKIRQEQAEAQAKIDAENARIAAENKKIQDEKDRIAREEQAAKDKKEREEREAKIREEARLKAIKEAEEKAIREQKEKEARELAEKKKAEKKAAMAPDKEKLITYANNLMIVPWPNVKSPEAQKVLDYAKRVLLVETNEIIKQAEAL